jgi:uncharacterized membrane protein YsdA (DUF1294 family)/cold shock CspA family protein
MERLGKVSEWNEARGFGFVAPVDDEDGTGRIFFHVRDYERGSRRPEVGELVKFSASKRDDGRLRANRVRRAVARANNPSPMVSRNRKPAHASPGRPAPASALVALVLAYATAIAIAIYTGRLPVMLLFWLIAANGLAMLFYYGDKTAAQRGESRVAESTLHMLELAGGWPAALLAQRMFRHKTVKASYRSGFQRMVILHITIVAVLAYARVLD